MGVYMFYSEIPDGRTECIGNVNWLFQGGCFTPYGVHPEMTHWSCTEQRPEVAALRCSVQHQEMSSRLE